MQLYQLFSFIWCSLINYVLTELVRGTTDKFIIENSGPINVLPSGAPAVAGRGFKNVDNLIISRGSNFDKATMLTGWKKKQCL